MTRRKRNDPGRGKPLPVAATSLLGANERRFTVASLALATVVGILLRTRAFQSAAQSWDACEYVWAIEGGYLPHSPYLIHHVLGRLLATVLPTGQALSLISFVAGSASIPLLGAIVLRLTKNAVAAIASAVLLATAPVHVWYSGVQEIYVLQGALVLAAVLLALGAGRRRDLAAGLVFGTAFAAHNGTAFLIPAFALALHRGPGEDAGTGPARRAGRAFAAALVMVGVAYGLVCAGFLLRDGVSGLAPFAEYVRGIAPLPREGSAWAPDRVLGSWRSALSDGMGIPSPLWPLGLVLGAFAVVRCTRDVVLWMVWGGLFLAYEFRLGTNLDRGLYAVYVAIPLTAILGIGIGIVARPGSLRRGATTGGPSAFARAFRRPAAVAALLLLVVPETVASWRAGSQKPSGNEFLSSALVQTCLWIRDHTPPETVVVQPPGLINVNLVPCYARRRPILLQAGRHHLFVGTRGSPLNLRSFRALDRGVLAELTRDGTPVYSFVADPFEARDPAPGGTDALFHWIPVEASITVGSVPHTTTLWRLAPGTGNPPVGSPESG